MYGWLSAVYVVFPLCTFYFNLTFKIDIIRERAVNKNAKLKNRDCYNYSVLIFRLNFNHATEAMEKPLTDWKKEALVRNEICLPRCYLQRCVQLTFFAIFQYIWIKSYPVIFGIVSRRRFQRMVTKQVWKTRKLLYVNKLTNAQQNILHHWVCLSW